MKKIISILTIIIFVLGGCSQEQEVEEIKENIGMNCGSGYPADKFTVEFLKNNYDNKEFDFIFRKSWKTYQKHQLLLRRHPYAVNNKSCWHCADIGLRNHCGCP